MCDEVSLVVAPCADGSCKTPSLFAAKEGFAQDNPIGFELKNAEVKDGGCLLLRYLVKYTY